MAFGSRHWHSTVHFEVNNAVQRRFGGGSRIFGGLFSAVDRRCFYVLNFWNLFSHFLCYNIISKRFRDIHTRKIYIYTEWTSQEGGIKMRISEILEALQEIQNVLGNVDVCVVLNDFDFNHRSYGWADWWWASRHQMQHQKFWCRKWSGHRLNIFSTFECEWNKKMSA